MLNFNSYLAVRRFLSIAIVAAFCQFNLSAQNIIYVNPAAVGSGHGTSWTNAFTRLDDALNNANANDTIWIAEGTYYPTPGTDRTISLTIDTDVVLLGGFDGTETHSNQRDYINHPTILSGDLNGDDGSDFANTSDNSYTVLLIEDATSATIIDGVTISGGNANVNSTNRQTNTSVGAVYNMRTGAKVFASPTFKNCTFKDNQAYAYGGAIFNDGNTLGQANPTFENCVFTNNHSAKSGGAVYNYGFNSGMSSPTFSDCSFTLNYAGEAGGVIYNDAQHNGVSSPTIVNCIFNANSANTSGAISYAGVIYNFGQTGGTSSPLIINSLFYDNIAFAAGVMYSLGLNGTASPTVYNCTFYSNRALQNGGAIYMNAGNAPGAGTCYLTVRNSIFWDNIAASIWQGYTFRNQYSTIDISHSLVEETSCIDLNRGIGGAIMCGSGDMIFNQDPQFIAPASGNLQLAGTSPAVDKGTDVPLTDNSVLVDLNGEARFVNSSDMGPYEMQSAASLPVEWLSFEAKLINGKTYLEWTTTEEYNNDYFQVERSIDGFRFEAINRVKSQDAFATSELNYAAIDEKPGMGHNYYRIKQVDFDGQFDYSVVAVVKVDGAPTSLFPNPANDRLNVNTGLEMSDRDGYRIFDLTGRLVQQGLFTDNESASTIQLNIPTGSYLIELHRDQQTIDRLPFIKM